MRSPPPPEWSNLEWLAALRGDGDAAWAAIRARVLRGLRAHLLRRPGLGDDLDALAEDVAQETLLTVRAKLETFRNDSRFTTWVHRIAVNALLGRLRQRRWDRRSAPDGSPDLPDELAGEAPTPELATLQRDLWQRVRHLIDVELTPRQRTVLLSHVFHDKPLDLLAADLGISRDAVYKTIHDARRKLRAALAAQGVTAREVLDIFQKGPQ
jgi:RNA polymerase sigma-70 factor (ECF subfamily)